MPRFKTHLTVAIGVGVALNVTKQMTRKVVDPDYQFDFVEMIAWGGLAALAGCAADMLEPALHPNHRSTCHSWAAAALILHVLFGEPTRNFTADERDCANLLGYPYLSHLLLDLMTKKGLPLI